MKWYLLRHQTSGAPILYYGYSVGCESTFELTWAAYPEGGKKYFSSAEEAEEVRARFIKEWGLNPRFFEVHHE